jgi:hypothetical protein
MGPRSWESFQGALTRGLTQLLISFSGIGFLFMEDYVPFVFLRSWVLVALYLCFRFRIFDRPVLYEYVFQVEKGPRLLQSCLCVVQNGLPPATKEMHASFKNLVVTGAPS